jgi:ParB-like chromosome segregation protein Spo0J
MEIKTIKIDELKFAEYNPRALSEKEAEDLKLSLQRFGFVEPIVVNSAPERMNVIIGGHQRVRVAKDMLGLTEVPVVYVEIPEIAKEQELNLRLNKNLGHWDWDLLANFDEKLLLEVGFEEIDLDKNFELNFDGEEFNFDYPFGTVNSFIRIGDFNCEIAEEKYNKLKSKIDEAGGIEQLIDRIIS